MDGAPTARGVRAGGWAPVSDSEPRPSLWRTIFASGPDVGYPGGRHCAPLAVAERVCRAGDRLDSRGMAGPRRRALRTASPRDPDEAPRLLPRDADPLLP